MNNLTEHEIKKITDLIISQNFTAEAEMYGSREGGIDVVVGYSGGGFYYQTSVNGLSINDEGTSLADLQEILLNNGFDTAFVEDYSNIYAVSEVIADILNVQQVYDDYMTTLNDNDENES